MTRTKILAAAVLLASAALCSSTLLLAADEKPDATVTFSGGTAGVGVGVTWGDGTLHYQGKAYPFRLKGVSIADVGGGTVQGAGEVYHLKRVEDFSGNYTAASAGAALAGGGAVSTMENQKGVLMKLHSTTQGLQFKAAVEGIAVELKR